MTTISCFLTIKYQFSNTMNTVNHFHTHVWESRIFAKVHELVILTKFHNDLVKSYLEVKFIFLKSNLENPSVFITSMIGTRPKNCRFSIKLTVLNSQDFVILKTPRFFEFGPFLMAEGGD